MTALSRIGAAIGVVILAAAAVAALLLTPRAAHRAATGQAVATSARPPQPQAPTACSALLKPFAAGGPAISQHPDGSLTGCIRIGRLTPGSYELRLPVPRPTLFPGLGVGAPGGSLHLNPAAGPPGSRVTLSAEVSPELAPATAVGGYMPHTLACWGGCRSGLAQWVAIDWSTVHRGAFDAVFQVPPGPWMGAGGGQRPDPGRYRIEVPCLTSVSSKLNEPCAGVSLSSDFELLKPDHPPGCWEPAACTWLRMSSTSVVPGDVVALDGWAPIRSLSALGTLDPWPNAYYLGHNPSGKLPAGPSGQPLAGPAVAPLAIVHFTVSAGLDFSDLGSLKPVWEQSGGEQPLAVSEDGTRLAYCANDGIRFSADGGTRWTTAPTAGQAGVAAAAGLLIARSGVEVPVCRSVVLDPRTPRTLYARFDVSPPEGAPPVFSIAAVSTDMGGSWRPLTPPAPATASNFGGFQPDRNGVDALFVTFAQTNGLPTPQTTVIRTTDGGVSWQPASLACPASGPCARLASDSEGSCAKGQSWQDLELSADGGRTWAVAPGMSRLTTCSPLHLVSLSSGRLLLFSGGDDPLLVSADGGHSWHPVELPEQSQSRSIQVLPDGSLLGNASLPLLTPGAVRWCPAGGVTAPAVVAAGRVWWRPQPPDGVRSIALADLHCSAPAQ